MARMLEAYLAFARGDLGEQRGADRHGGVPRGAQGRRRAQRPQGERGVPRAADRHRAAGRVQALPRQSGVERRALRAVDLDHRPPRPPLAHRHGGRRRPGHSAGHARGSVQAVPAARRCAQSGRGRHRARASRSRATSRARTAATSRSATARSAACGRRCGCRCRLGFAATSRRRSSSRGAGGGAGRGRCAAGIAHRSSRKPAQRSALARPRSSAAMVRSRPGSSSSNQTRQHAGEHQRRALRAQRAARAGGADAGGLQHPVLRAHGHGVEREREARIAPRRAQQRAHRLLVGRERFEPAHQHVEQPLARRLLGHVGIAAGEHRAVDVLDVGGEDGERRAEFGAQLPRASGRRGRRPRRGRSPRSECSASSAISASIALSRSDVPRGGGGGSAPCVDVSACGPWRPPAGCSVGLNLGPQRRRF